MNKYRFVLLSLQGRTLDGLLQDCIDDLDALEKARTLSANRIVEVWQGGRNVAVVRMGDALPSAQDGSSL